MKNIMFMFKEATIERRQEKIGKVRNSEKSSNFFTNLIIYSIFNYPLNNNILITFRHPMCYLRNFTPIQKPFYSKPQESADLESDTLNFSHASDSQFGDFELNKNLKSGYVQSNQPQLFLNILKLAQMNSEALKNLQMKMEENNCLMDEIQGGGKGKVVSESVQATESEGDQSCVQDGNGFKSEQFLTKKLFGNNKEYKYKLLLDGDFPQQIFKERNFSFSLKLADIYGNVVRNSNIIHLCLAISDSNGQWITETKTKQPLMKGKTQSELYHGYSSYQRIFYRDVSRNYPDGKFNIVIYPKQSVLKYFHKTNCFEQMVDSSQIQPLVVKNMAVKAKKKQ